MSNVNISTLRGITNYIISNQIKTTQPAYANQVSTVNSVAITSLNMNLNSKTGTIIVNTSTGTITVSQPIVNPIPVNNPTAFISTNNNSVTVTSKGADDTIISSVLDTISNIQDVTNSGYTKNNSISNLYDSISSNYWNPQVNIGNVNPYFYKLNYTFTGTNKIFKFVIKNNNDFPGFTNIRLYPTTEPSNYTDIEPFVDTNNQYVNETIALLIDDNGNPLFDTDKITAEFTLNPSIQPDTYYQYGQAYGVIYDTNTLGLRAGNYINTNTGAGEKLQWTTSYLENQTTATGTNNTDNNYIVSSDGVYRIAQNRTFYQWSVNSGTTYTKKTLTTTSNMKSTPDGQYIMVSNNTIGYVSDNYGDTFTNKSLDTNFIYNYFDTLYTGEYQMFVSEPVNFGGTLTNIKVYKNANYGSGIFEDRLLQYIAPSVDYNIEIINVIQKIDGTVLVVINARYNQIEGVAYGVVVYGTQIAGDTFPVLDKTIMFSSDINPTILAALEQNYSNDSNEGQYKTGFGLYNYNGTTGDPCFFVTNNDGSTPYLIYNNSSLFPEYNTGISNPSLRLQIRNCGIKISNNGLNQVVIVQWYYINSPSLPDLITSYYSIDSGNTWNKSSVYPTYLNTFSNIVANSDFSIIQACGGYYYSYNGQYRTDPISYLSTDGGETWVLNSAVNPASSIISTNFYTVESVTNKTYFQVKDLNQNQVLGVSDNGFNMTKDLRVNNSNAYVLGGTFTVGPDEASALLNDYSFNVDGTVSARNIVLLSDERFKNILDKQDNNDSFNKINQLKIIKYKFKDRPDDDRVYTGMIAQQVKEVIDDAVDINSSTYQTDQGIINVNDVYSINYTSIISYLISSFQYTNNKLNLLENYIKLKLNNNINKI
jgi:hypothetical protein